MNVTDGCLSTLISWNKVIDVTHQLVPGAEPAARPHARSRAVLNIYPFLYLTAEL